MRKYQLTGPLAPRSACANLNHRRPHAALRHCSTCGDVVNPAIRGRRCSKAQHMASRRRDAIFCLDCGTRLVASEQAPTPGRVSPPTPAASPQRGTASRVTITNAAAGELTARVNGAAGAPTADGKPNR